MRYNNTELLYNTDSLCGWTIKYQPGLWEHHPSLKHLLQQDLEEIKRLLPAAMIRTMREVMIFINISYRYRGHNNNILGACFHQSAAWLTEV